MRFIDLSQTHESKLLVFRRGGGEDTQYEIRFAHFRNGEMWAHDTEPFQAKAKSMKELKDLMAQAVACIDGNVVRAQTYVTLPEKLV